MKQEVFSILARTEGVLANYRSGPISTIVAFDGKFVEWLLNLPRAGKRL